MIDLAELNLVQLLFIAGFAGTILTIPLQDIISVGFFDITDFFLGMVATACIALIFNKPDVESLWLLTLIYVACSIVLIILKIVVILPFRNRAENSTTFSMKTLAGKQGSVTTTITKEAMGEVMVYAGFTKINKGARIYSGGSEDDVETISVGSEVLIIEVKDNILYVIPYVNDIQLTKAEQSWNNK